MNPGSRGDESATLDRVSAYDYRLPPDLIAKYPSERRDASRLLRVGIEGSEAGPAEGVHLDDLVFSDLIRIIPPGDLVVVNDSRVIPARLLGRKPTGAACEVLLVRPLADSRERWEALVRPGSKLKPGARVLVGSGLTIAIESVLEGGARVVRLESDLDPDTAIERWGHVPLPPYIDRDDEALDRDRYQTVYARERGSVAAPTAGLHFTQALMRELESEGVGVATVTLHVGPGTFRPVEGESLDEHLMHEEWWTVTEEAAGRIAETRAAGGRVWAIGTTVVRTLETAGEQGGRVRAGSGSTRLFISPGYHFNVVDALVTNFHLPRSTLLMLVAAFAGYRNTMDTYRHAVESGYRFYSYGDAMVVPPWKTS